MPIPGLDLASFITSLAGGVVSGIAGQNSQQWSQGLLMKLLEDGGAAQQDGKNKYSDIINSLLPSIIRGTLANTEALYGSDGNPGSLSKTGDNIASQNAQIPGLFSGANNWQSGNQDLSSLLQNLVSGQSGAKDTANAVFQGGGWTPQGQQGFDQISKLLNGGLQDTGAGRSTMESLFSNGGSTDFTSALQNAGRQSISDGGYTPTLNAAGKPLGGILDANGDTSNNDILRQFGIDALETGGYTPNSLRGASSALQGVESGGATPTTTGIQDRGLDLFNREALLPLEQVLSMARDEAGGNALDASKKARTQAINRGGGPGATVANGMQNQGFADFADMIARNESDNVTKALLGQQQLQQNEQLAGGQAATQGANAETARLNTSSDLLSSLESGATSRYNVGGNMANSANQNETTRLLSALGLIPDIQNSATNVMGTVGGLGVQGGKLDNERTSLGTDLFKALTSNELGQNSVGLESLIKLLGNQQNYTLGAGQLGNDISSTQGSQLAQLLSNNLGGGQLTLQGLQSLISAMQGGTKNELDFTSLLAGNQSNNVAAGQNAANPWMQYAGQGMNMMGNTAGGPRAQNPFENLGR
jgi:hypothetical protein